MKGNTGMVTMGKPADSSDSTATGTKTGTTTTRKTGNSGRVVAIRQEPRILPGLYHTVHVVGPENGPSFAQMLARAGCKKAENGVEDADIVFFTGGSVDIHPMMYGLSDVDTHESVTFESQDCIDTMLEYIDVFQECIEVGAPMVGICLGAQFLHVMNGGKLYQDVDNHYTNHPMFCNRTGKTITEISSVHHQMCIENDVMEVLGTSYEANERWRSGSVCDLVIDKPDDEDVEAFWYPDTLSLGVQGHPEYQGFPEYTDWFLEEINHHIVYNKDLEYEDTWLRLPKKLRDKRKYELPRSVQQFIKEYS